MGISVDQRFELAQKPVDCDAVCGTVGHCAALVLSVTARPTHVTGAGMNSTSALCSFEARQKRFTFDDDHFFVGPGILMTMRMLQAMTGWRNES